MEVGENFELLAKEVEGDGENSADRETPQETVVDGTNAKHLHGAESTPKDRSGEERVVPWAGEVILLLGQADVGDPGHLVVEDGRADEGGDESSPHLAGKGDPRSDVHVVGELEILSKVEGVRGGDITVRLEIVQSCCVTREPEATEKFCDNVQGDLDVRNGHDDTARDTEDDSEENCTGW